jgi:hypothetical protein
MRGDITSLHPAGAKMHNPLAFDSQTQHTLDVLGAEPLAGSGFEDELTDPSFEADEVPGEEG